MNRNMIGYTCKYTPIELLAGFGAECALLNEETESFSVAEEQTHANLCCHTKAMMQFCEEKDIKELVLVNCCDSVRRAYDVLKKSGKLDFLYFLDLPHNDSVCARGRFKNELISLAESYEEYSGRSFDVDLFIKSFKKATPMPNGDFIAVLGARAGNELMNSIEKKIPISVWNGTCSNNRSVTADDNFKSLSFDELMEQYANALLSQLPCMRMGDISGRKQLLLSPNLKGILYHTVKFCDYYGFEYSNLKNETSLPILKFETDFTAGSAGQISTRLEAFSESLFPKINNTVAKGGKFAVGIDSGSTSTDVVILDGDGNICSHAVVRTGAKAAVGAKKALEQALQKCGCTAEDIGYTVATGYGRNSIEADEAITEITCHAKGAHRLRPQTKTIIDIGGQDSKVIILNDDGTVKSFMMNDKCAAGTGRFLELMAQTLEISLDEMSRAGLHYRENLVISSMCTVFAESEVVSLVAQNHSTGDIVHGLNCSVANRTASMANRAGGKPEYQMTGGVARNKGVVKALEEKLNAPLWIADDPDICGALGAAMFAVERMK